jgi:hypothetical protein
MVSTPQTVDALHLGCSLSHEACLGGKVFPTVPKKVIRAFPTSTRKTTETGKNKQQTTEPSDRGFSVGE